MSLDALGSAIDSSVAEGHLPDVFSPQEPFKLYRRRLHWLGYLSEENPVERLDAELQKALVSFQRDASIKVTGNPNKNTFNMLDVLVGFEPSKQNLKIIDTIKASNVSLKKARMLRLSMYGLLPKGLNSNPIQTTRALTTFKNILISLAVPSINKASPSKMLDHFLFNLDAITTKIKGFEHEFQIVIPKEIKKRGKKEFLVQVDIFLRNLASIELWLYGYDIKLQKLALGKTNINSALVSFWQDAPASDRPSKKYQKYVTAKLFQRLNALQETDDEQERELSSEVLERMSNEGEFRDNIKKEGKNVFSRLWDGLKRATKFLFDLFKRGAQALTSFVKGAARWLVSSARSIFDHISIAFNVTKIGFEYAIRKKFISKPSGAIVTSRFMDYDRNSYINTMGDSAEIKAESKRQRIASKMFSVGLRIIAALTKLLKSMTKVITTTWLLLFWSLCHLKQDLLALKQNMVTAKDLLVNWNELTGIS
jgi:hypothetical protein